MSRNDLSPCGRCGRRRAFPEESWVQFAQKGGPPNPPPIPSGVCFECALEDPALREPLRSWAAKDVGTWGEQRMREYVHQLRQLLARPLEAIDRFVDSLR